MTERTLSLLDTPPDDQPDETLPAPAGWPAPPDRAAYHELPGEIVHHLSPETESDPVAILTQLLVAFGAAVGRGAWFGVEATRHHPNEYMCLTGDTARAREGASWDHVRRLITTHDPSDTRPADPDRPIVWRRGHLERPGSGRSGPRSQRSAPARDRARVRL